MVTTSKIDIDLTCCRRWFTRQSHIQYCHEGQLTEGEVQAPVDTAWAKAGHRTRNQPCSVHRSAQLLRIDEYSPDYSRHPWRLDLPSALDLHHFVITSSQIRHGQPLTILTIL